MWKNTGERKGMKFDWWDRLKTVEIIISLVKHVLHLLSVFEGKYVHIIANTSHIYLFPKFEVNLI